MTGGGETRRRSGSAPRRPLLGAAVCLAAGCAFPLGATAPVAPLLALAAALCSLVLVWPEGRRRGQALVAVAFALGVVGATLEEAEYEGRPLRQRVVARAEEGVAVALTGTLVDDPDVVGGRGVLVIDVDATDDPGEAQVSGRLRVFVAGQTPLPTLIEGDRVRVSAVLKPPSPPRNPGGFDASAYARRTHVHALGYTKSALLVERVARGRGSLRTWVARLRQLVRERLLARLHEGPDAGIVRAMVLGDRAGLDPETEETFRIAGTYHVLALSGAQVALVAGLLLWAARWASLSLASETVLAVGGVLVYAVFVGGDVPVLRAAVMATVLLLGRALGLVGEATNLLGLAAMLLLAWRPSWVGDVGFQLSFAATLSIILLTPLLTPYLRWLPRWIGLGVAASLAAQAGVLPLLALHFHRVTPLAPLLNLAAVPLSTGVLLAGFGVVATSWAGPLAALCAYVAEGAARLMRISGSVAQWGEWVDVRVPTPGPALLLLYGAALVALVVSPRRRLRAAGLLGLASVGLVLGTGGPLADGRTHLTVLDVGRGDALVLRSPAGRVMAVDTGGVRPGGPPLAETTMAPFLWALGVRRLETLVLTHAHADHVGGAAFMRRAFDVREVWTSPPTVGDDGGEVGRMLREARVLRAGWGTSWDGVTIDVLWPDETPPASANEASLVLRLRFGDVVLLLTGDVDARVEGQLRPGRVDVLKVPHHGSRTSSSEAFVAGVRPRLALVSCGRAGVGPGADPAVVERYVRRGARVFRTDEEGAIEVSTDGTRLWWRTASGGGQVQP